MKWWKTCCSARLLLSQTRSLENLAPLWWAVLLITSLFLIVSDRFLIQRLRLASSLNSLSHTRLGEKKDDNTGSSWSRSLTGHMCRSELVLSFRSQITSLSSELCPCFNLSRINIYNLSVAVVNDHQGPVATSVRGSAVGGPRRGGLLDRWAP